MWVSQGISRFDAFDSPLCFAVFGKAGASGPGNLRQFARAFDADIALHANEQGTLPVTVTSLSGEVRETVDLIAHLKSDRVIKLQWGDIVELPLAAGEAIREAFSPEVEIDVRVDLGNGNFFANAENLSGPVMRIQSGENLDLAAVLRAAAVAPYFVASTTLMRATEEALEMRKSNIRHGDVIEVQMIDPKQSLSERAQRDGIFVCQSLDGPFWPIGDGWNRNYHPAKSSGIGNLLLAAVSPSGLPLQPVDWDRAFVRRRLGAAWEEVPLMDAIMETEKLKAFTLVLPVSETGSRGLPENLRAKLAEESRFDWHLGVLDEPPVAYRYEAPFFRIERMDGKQIWRDLNAEHAPRPVTSDLNQLLMVHPRHRTFGNYVYVDGGKGILVESLRVHPTRRPAVVPPSSK